MTKVKKMKLPVEFQGLSIGKETARLGVKFSREILNTEHAEYFLCGAQLDVIVKLTKDDEPALLPETLPELNCIVESKRFSVSVDGISAGLTFIKSAVDANLLCQFASHEGTITMKRIGDACGKDEPQQDSNQ